MPSLRTTFKLAPVIVLAALAIGTSLQVGCSGRILVAGQDASVDNGNTEDLPEPQPGCAKTPPYYGYGGYGGYGGYYPYGGYPYGDGCNGP